MKTILLFLTLALSIASATAFADNFAPEVNVENAEEADLLKTEGVDLLQGWHCGKPEIDPDWLN